MLHHYLVKRLLLLALSVSFVLHQMLLPFPTVVRSQSSCSAYNVCLGAQGTSGLMVQGPITYWFDASVDLYLNPDDANDFRNRVAAAVADWVVKTNVSIIQGTAGQVKIMISASEFYQRENGIVQSDGGGQAMIFSNEWPDWTAAAKDRVLSHECGTHPGIARCTLKRLRECRDDHATVWPWCCVC